MARHIGDVHEDKENSSLVQFEPINAQVALSVVAFRMRGKCQSGNRNCIAMQFCNRDFFLQESVACVFLSIALGQ